MPFNREPGWLSREPVKTARTEFNEALKNDPFAGAVAVEALANFIKATDTLRSAPKSRVTAEAATQQVIARIVEARDAAEAVPDPTYTQIFESQLTGWEAAARTIEGKSTPQVAPTQTAAKDMSDSKSKPSNT